VPSAAVGPQSQTPRPGTAAGGVPIAVENSGPDAASLGVRQAERDIGRRPGLTTDERARFKQLERENVEAPAYD